MKIKVAIFVAALFAAAAFAPTVSADSQTFELIVQGKDYSAIDFGGGKNEFLVVVPIQPGSVMLFQDAVMGTGLGTVVFNVFDPGTTLDFSYSLSNAVINFFDLEVSSGQLVNFVGFSYTKLSITEPGGSTGTGGTVPEPAALEMLGFGMLCIAGLWARK